MKMKAQNVREVLQQVLPHSFTAELSPGCNKASSPPASTLPRGFQQKKRGHIHTSSASATDGPGTGSAKTGRGKSRSPILHLRLTLLLWTGRRTGLANVAQLTRV